MEDQFKQFKKVLQENFAKVSKDADKLFEVNVDKEELWNLYLDSFPEGTNELYRERREYDCCCCRQFIRNIGNAVIVKDNKVTTIWDFEIDSTTFQPVANALSEYVKSKAITDIYVSKMKKIGTDHNLEQLKNGEIMIWEHFYLELPNKFVDTSSKSEGDIKGGYRAIHDVFKKSLDVITEESVLTVLELISQNSLHRGNEWEHALKEFLKYKQLYDKLQTKEEKEVFAWEQSIKAGAVVGKIKNHSMGTLLVNISEGMDLDTSVRKFEFIVGDGYKRSNPIYTEKMLKDATKTIIELGYMDSLARRYATLDDITVNNILFSNKDSAKRISNATNIFEEMLNEASNKAKKFSKTEEISIENFVNNVLPNAKEIEVFLENKHSNNMVSLIAPKDKDSKTMFKWDNNFSWAYSGNITDSSMKDRVKSAGGDVNGILRFSIQWNDDRDYNPNDFDAHCIEPNRNEIYYGNKTNIYTTGKLDVDIQYPSKGEIAVENITWIDRDKMKEGNYSFFVHNYSHNGGRTGFKAEIEFDGQLYSFEYNKELRNGEKVQVAEVTFNKDTGFNIKEKLPSSVSSKEVWNLKTNNFIPVSVVCHSPNYWNEQYGIGNKHYIFMLKDCINPEKPNSFYNEFLNQELYEHRKFMEALGSKMKVEDNDDQLSGLGFSSTKRNELIVKVKGQTERILKIKF